jgi:hypothetical protein
MILQNIQKQLFLIKSEKKPQRYIKKKKIYFKLFYFEKFY